VIRVEECPSSSETTRIGTPTEGIWIDVVSMHVFGYGRSGTPGAIDSGSSSGGRATGQSLRQLNGLGDR
jgi:hypothetical protein